MKLGNEEADEYVKKLISNSENGLLVKAREYAREEDRMHNFNEAARIKNISREEAIDGMRLKHIISINDIRKDITEGKLPAEATVMEKFGDTINYYILEAMSILHKVNNSKKE